MTVGAHPVRADLPPRLRAARHRVENVLRDMGPRTIDELERNRILLCVGARELRRAVWSLVHDGLVDVLVQQAPRRRSWVVRFALA